MFSLLKRWLFLPSVVIAVLSIFAFSLLIYGALPSATGYAAHYLCVQTLIGGRDPNHVFAKEVKPLNPLFNLVNFDISKSNGTVQSASFFGIREATALYRPQLGCTLTLHEDIATLKQQVVGRAVSSRLEADENSYLNHKKNKGLQTVLDEAMSEPSSTSLRNTHALIVLYQGNIVGERYAKGISSDTPLLGWSMAKTVAALLAGVLVKDNQLSLKQDRLLPEWSSNSDPRHAIQLKHLLQWTSGIDFQEGYLPGSDTTNMLYQSADMASYVSALPLKTLPSTEISYQSGGSVILGKVIARTISERPLDIVPFAQERLFSPLGIDSAILEPDTVGNIVAGSYMLASARDWTKIGQLILQQGNWEGLDIVRKDWIRFMSTPQLELNDSEHGAHLWLNHSFEGKQRFPSLPEDMVMLDGFNHQLVAIIPSRQVVITRLGATLDDSWDTERFILDVLNNLSEEPVTM